MSVTIYFVSIPSDTRCWLQGPITEHKRYMYKGEARSKRIVAKTEKAPITVEAVAKSLHDCLWYRRKVAEGTKGPIEYEFTKRQVTLCKDGQPEKMVWLVMKRTIGKHPSYWYYISNAPVSTRLPLFIWLSGIRWAIEQCFEEVKTELGMDQYELRKYPGWHHHMLTCMLAHFFLWHMKIRLGKKAPAITVSQLRLLLEVVLPLRTYTIAEVLRLVAWIQQRNHQAFLAHKRRRKPPD